MSAAFTSTRSRRATVPASAAENWLRGMFRFAIGGTLVSLTLLVGPGCDSDTVVPKQATSGPETHPNIRYEEIVYAERDSATGGDPRGVYAPNNPLLVLYPPSDPNVTVTEVPIEKYGSGTVTFTGTTPRSGIYTTDDWFLSVRTTITFREDTTVVTFPVDASGVFLEGSGTWETFDEGLMVLDGRDSIDYAVDDRGMYLYRYIPFWRTHEPFPPLLVPVIKVLKK